MKIIKAFLIVIALALMTTAGAVQAKDITLSWDASPSDGVDGYRVYCQADDTTPPFPKCGHDVTDGLTATIPDLEDGRVYSFAVTAYNTTGESAYSNIVSETPIPGEPGTLRIQTVVNVTVNVNQE